MKILIANRSEIALRVIRTATELGIDTVVGYADADFDTPFTRASGEAHALGGDTLAETYMNGDKLIELARATGAAAVHPGYGFLSESPEFAEAVVAAGLTWIGRRRTRCASWGTRSALASWPSALASSRCRVSPSRSAAGPRWRTLWPAGATRS